MQPKRLIRVQATCFFPLLVSRQLLSTWSATQQAKLPLKNSFAFVQIVILAKLKRKILKKGCFALVKPKKDSGVSWQKDIFYSKNHQSINLVLVWRRKIQKNPYPVLRQNIIPYVTKKLPLAICSYPNHNFNFCMYSKDSIKCTVHLGYNVLI